MSENFMTKKQLKQLYFLSRELQMWQCELEKLMSSSIISTPELQHTPCARKISDRVGNIAVALDYTKDKIEEKQSQIQKERCKLQNFINAIQDSYIRQIMFYRYVLFLSWTAVSVKIGGNNNKDTVRVAHDRYLKNSFKFLQV